MAAPVTGSGMDIRDLAPLMRNLDQLPPDQLAEVMGLFEQLAKRTEQEQCQTEFIPFVHKMWPNFIEGYHHKIMARAFEKIAQGKLKRLIINMAPRHTKSEFASHMLPAWYLGQNPSHFVIQASNTAELAVGFGRKVRGTVQSSEYQEVFPEVELNPDAKAAGRWMTNSKGEYYAAGITSTITGKGANLLIIDDPHDEQDGASDDPEAFSRVYEWYTSGPRQRLQPDAAVVIVMTRWHKLDLTGIITKRAIEDKDAEQWEVIELPAIMPSGKPIWPGYWSLEALTAVKNEIPGHKWQAQYQQNPTSRESSLIKEDWWRRWEDKKPPECEYLIQSWDTGFLANKSADPSAMTTWGVFYMENENTGKMMANIILLDAYTKRLEFPDLKEKVYEMFTRWQPDTVVVEAKASGLPLYFEMRQRGVPIQTYTPTRGNNKRVRVNAVSDMFSSGVVWAPFRPYADKVIEQFADFPHGVEDDLVDSSTQALIRFRQGGFIPLASDYDREEEHEPIDASGYY